MKFHVKLSMVARPLRIRINKINGFIKIYDGVRSSILFDYERYNASYDRIKYLKSGKSGITDIINHNFARIRTDSYNSLPPIDFS